MLLAEAGARSSKAVERASSWSVRPGLASASGVSFESVDEPGRYLTAPKKGSGAITLARNDGTKAFAGRATLAVVGGAGEGGTSFRLWKDRSLVLRHSGSALVAAATSSSAKGKADSTFSVRTGLVPAPSVPLVAGRSVGLVAAGRTDYRVGRDGSDARLVRVQAKHSASVASRTTWIVRSGLSSKQGVSFESRDRPGWFLVAPKHGSGAAAVAKRSGSASFAARATFTKTTGVHGANATFRVRAHPTLVPQAADTRLVVRTLGGSVAARTDGTFKVRSGLAPARTR